MKTGKGVSQLWRRNAVVAVIAVFVCAAVYLNWNYEQQAGKVLGESTMVGNEDPLLTGQEQQESQEDQSGDGSAAQDGAAQNTSDYFANARLNRQQARDSAVSLLQEAAEQEGAGEAAATEASEGIAVLAGYTMKEAQIENLVTAKGYADCVAFMGDEGVSVVVATETGELTEEDVAKITDITVNETGYAASSVRIMAAN